jgi:type I restriction enzyme, S subunit
MMNKIEKLIEEFCPQGVEFLALGDCIQKNTGGGTPSKAVSSYWNGDIPWASVGDLSNEGIMIDTTRNFITQEGLQNSSSHLIPRNDVIVAVKISPGKMKIAGSDIAINQDLRGLSLKSFLNNRFLTYYFKTINVIGNGTIVKAINVSTLNRIQIPIPPLSIQKEIVTILDNFTQLEAELEARKRQYEHYREELLSFEDDVEFRALGEVADYSRTRISATELNDERYVGVDNLLQNKQGKTVSNCVPITGNLTRYENGDILIGNIRPYLKKIWFATNVGGTNGDVLVVQINQNMKNDLGSKYLYHLLASDNFFSYNMQFAKGAKMPRGDKSAIMKFKIPIPPLSKQQEIVAILDKFDALVNDISTGLPAEIATRKKQYEYYRNQLLTFKPLDSFIPLDAKLPMGSHLTG